MRHPGRWLFLCLVALLGSAFCASLVFGERPVRWGLAVISVLVVLVSLFYKARRQGTRPYIFTWCWAAAGSAYSSWAWYLLSISWWSKALLISPVTAYAMRHANTWFQFDVEEGQRRREAAMAAMARRVMAGDRALGPFALYLRPFASTGRLPAQPSPSSMGSHPEVPSHLDVETVFGRALRDRCPIVALGRSGDISEGAARIATSDEEWQSLMAALSDRSEFVVMLPLASPSTSWELKWLTEHDFLGKVMMLMPETRWPLSSGFTFSIEKTDRIFEVEDPIFMLRTEHPDQEQHHLNLAAEWHQAIQAAREIGVELPLYANVGALFTMEAATGKVARLVPLPLSMISYGRRAGYVRAAITALGFFNAEPKRVSDLISALEYAVFFRDATLEITLTRSADGYVRWGDISTGAMLLGRAAALNPHRPAWVSRYLNALPELVYHSSLQGDDEAVARYEAVIHAVREYPELAALMGQS
jgi:hypothetical protein